MPAPTLLSQDLRNGTMEVHSIAENSTFIKRYMRGELSRAAYAQFLISLHHIYSALEETLDQHADDDYIRVIHFPNELRRVPEIEKDLEYYIGPNWREQTVNLPKGAIDYANHIRELGRTRPMLLIAHSYTRYLGDLSGGQILARRTRKFLDLPPNKGTAFYEFKEIDKPDEFKNKYRAALDSIPITAEERHDLVEEAKLAFRLNVNLFDAHEHLIQQDTKQKAISSRGLASFSLRKYGSVIAIGTWLAIAVAYLGHRGAFDFLLRN
jgi:heme oxygenase